MRCRIFGVQFRVNKGKQHLALKNQHDVMKCKNLSDAIEVVNRELLIFDWKNLVSTLRHLTTLALPNQHLLTQNKTFIQLVSELEARMNTSSSLFEMSWSGVPSIAWCLALVSTSQAKVTNESTVSVESVSKQASPLDTTEFPRKASSILNIIDSFAVSRVEQLTRRSASHLSLAFAVRPIILPSPDHSTTHPHEVFLRNCFKHFAHHQRMKSFHSSDNAMLSLSIIYSNLHSDTNSLKLLRVIADWTTTRIKSTQSRYLADIAWAIVRAGLTKDSARARSFMAAVCAECIERNFADMYDNNEIAALAWAIATFYAPKRVENGEEITSSSRTTDNSHQLIGATRARVTLRKLLPRLEVLVHDLQPDAAVSIIWAFGRLNVSCSSFLKAVLTAQRLEKSVFISLPKQSQRILMWMFGRADIAPVYMRSSLDWQAIERTNNGFISYQFDHKAELARFDYEG
eukprot:c47_g1_i1.p1 GENE.c47_g1_i1~~c47_g1_i1.p1  ORF type:complete len:459 (+),score=68.82 c47_g1_i1:44-1420(+)